MNKMIASVLAVLLSPLLAGPAPAAENAPRKTLTAFADEAQLRAFFQRYADERRARQRDQRLETVTVTGSSIQKSMPTAPVLTIAPLVSAPAAAPSPAPPADKSAAAAESVTNTQSAGVDEGGIVKVHGKHLVMLRRGRLFTVDLGGGGLRPVSAIDAFAPGTDPSGTWYDEMLISGDTVAVIGYSYSRGGTEIGLFDIDRAGRLAYRATYHMRSNDYYSSRNYASRQIGSKLVFYTPLHLNPWRSDPMSTFPALRKWRPDATGADFKRIAPATSIYRTDEEPDLHGALALHTVTVCDLASREMTCEATAVLGPRGRVFYVSSQSVYVWTAPGRKGNGASGQAGVFRIPLDGAAPSALKAAGSPVDQFSFYESADGHLNVLVRAGGQGDGMWRAERGRGQLALMRVALNLFSDGRDSAPAESYLPLPPVQGYGVQNRYVGHWLLYGSAAGHLWAGAEAARHPLHALRWDGSGQVQTLRLPHAVQRIEAMGPDAVVIGSAGGDLHFTSIALTQQASVAYRYIRENAAQSESRSHGFFYKPGSTQDGIVGLPITTQGASADGQEPGRASVLYLRNQALRLDELGSLRANTHPRQDDGCRASCVDWYGNARALFLQGRVFALMGYELVEGKLTGARIAETRRVSFAPLASVPPR